jgi:hypothetical protein
MIGVWASLSDAVRLWLRLLTHVKFIHTCYAVDGHLTLLCLCSGVGDFRIIGEWASLSDVVMSWPRLQTHVKFIPHPYM